MSPAQHPSKGTREVAQGILAAPALLAFIIAFVTPSSAQSDCSSLCAPVVDKLAACVANCIVSQFLLRSVLL